MVRKNASSDPDSSGERVLAGSPGQRRLPVMAAVWRACSTRRRVQLQQHELGVFQDFDQTIGEADGLPQVPSLIIRIERVVRGHPRAGHVREAGITARLA